MNAFVAGIAVLTVVLVMILRRQHGRARRAWAGWEMPDSSGYTRFQVECERAVTDLLAPRGLMLEERCVEDLGCNPPSRSVRATLGDTGWMLWIDENAAYAQLAGPDAGPRLTRDQSCVNLQPGGFGTPEELIASVVAHVQSVLEGRVQ